MWGVPKIIDAAKFVWELPGRIAGFLTGGGKELDKAGDEAFNNISKDVDTDVKQEPKADQTTPETKGAPKETKEIQTGEQQAQPTQKLFGGGKVDKYEDGGKVEDRGGEVKGPKGKDRVPAMLTDGEFVMSKGAVQEYGADTLAGMNAAAGGTNKPDMVKVPHFSGGGPVGCLLYTSPSPRDS